MDSKMTLVVGIVAVLAGLALCFVPAFGLAVKTVLAGSVALLVLLAGILFVFMGVVQVREDRDLLAKEQEAAAAKQAMAAEK